MLDLVLLREPPGITMLAPHVIFVDGNETDDQTEEILNRFADHDDGSLDGMSISFKDPNMVTGHRDIVSCMAPILSVLPSLRGLKQLAVFPNIHEVPDDDVPGLYHQDVPEKWIVQAAKELATSGPSLRYVSPIRNRYFRILRHFKGPVVEELKGREITDVELFDYCIQSSRLTSS